MNDVVELLARGIAIGIGGAALMDAWALLARAAFNVQGLDYALLGRWIGHFPRRRFFHDRIAAADPVPGERLLGWVAHYAIGIAFAMLLLAIWGLDWARSPTPWPALLVGLVTIAAPWFVMQPAMGAGIAGSMTPNPGATRLRNLATHTVYGIGLYASAALLAIAVLAVTQLWDPSAIKGSFDVGGRSLYLECVGEGSPTIVMESGSGSDHTAWEAVVPGLRDSNRTCTYDRANIGASSELSGDRTSSDVAADLHGLLDTASISPPYVLVGHSLGGISMRIFATTYPSEVAALVLVDATPTTFVEDACAVVDAAQCETFRSDFQPANNNGVDIASSSDDVAALGPLPAMPLVVMTANDHGHDRFAPDMRREFEAMWLLRQREVAESVMGGRLQEVDGGHNIQAQHPELVISAVSSVVADLAAGTP
jgi:pimeloyl-ACP methyl ester carboxylesterase